MTKRNAILLYDESMGQRIYFVKFFEKNILLYMLTIFGFDLPYWKCTNNNSLVVSSHHIVLYPCFIYIFLGGGYNMEVVVVELWLGIAKRK